MSFRYILPVFIAFLCLAPVQAQTYVDVINPDGDPSLWDLTYRDGFLYATDTSGDQVLRIDPATGATTVAFSTSFDPRGVAWDGTNWRVSTGFDSSDPRIYTYAPDGTELGSIPAPGGLTHGLELHDGLLFAAQAHPDPDAAIRGLDPATGAIQETIAFPQTQPGGIAFTDLNTLWAANVGDDGTNIEELYEIDRQTGAVLQTLDIPAGTARPRGLAYDGSRFLYLVLREGTGSDDYRIYVIDLGSTGNPSLSLSASALDFGPRVFGSDYDLTLILFNTGDGPLDVSDVAITGPDAARFATSLTATTIPAASNLNVTVTFSPAAYGARSAALSFATNDVQNPTVSVPLSGIGIYAEQHIAFTDDSHDYGPVRVDPPDAAAFSAVRWPLEIVNQGAQSLTVTGITVDDDAFTVLGNPFPITLGTLETAEVEIEFRPTQVRAYTATASVASNDPANPTATVALAGEGVNPDLDGGDPIWTLDAPDNPSTSSDDMKVFSARVLGDVTGDGIPDLAFATRNYHTFVVDGNGWGTPSILWTFNSCPDNNNCGAVSGNSQLFDYGMEASRDFNGDGINDVVIGTEGGNDHVYVLDGPTGEVIWEVGSDSDPYLASYYSVSLGLDEPGVPGLYDVDGDGVSDVATGTGSASPESPNPFNHRRVYLLSGADGTVLRTLPTALPNFRTLLAWANSPTAVPVPILVSGGGESGSNFLTAWRADTGAELWSISPTFSPFIIESLPDHLAAAVPNDLIVAGLGSLVQRLNVQTGAVVWTANAGGSSVWDVAMVDMGDGTYGVAVGSQGIDVRLLDGETGQERWQYNLGSQVFGVDAVPDTNNDGIEDVAATSLGGQTVLLSGADGSLLWQYSQGGERGEVVIAVPDLEGNGVPEVALGTYDLGARTGRAILLYGGGAPITIDAEPGETPAAFALEPAYPNPFNPSTTLRYRLPETATVELAAFDVLGRQVWLHTVEAQPAGTYTLRFDGTGLASGTYVVRLNAGAFVQTQRVTLVK